MAKNAFVEAAKEASNRTVTENGAMTNVSSLSACVDFFFQIGSSRTLSNAAIIKLYTNAVKENEKVANAILLYSRDCRGGMGERKAFITIVNYLNTKKSQNELVQKLLNATPHLGRFKDLLEMDLRDENFEHMASIYAKALQDEDQKFLAAKWAYRKSPKGRSGYVTKFVNALGMERGEYRRKIAELSEGTLERKLTEKRMDEVNLSQVSAVAMARNMKAIEGQAKEKFEDFVDDVEEGKAEIKAGAIFPYDVLRQVDLFSSWSGWSGTSTATQKRAIEAQWAALPELTGGKSVMPIIDVSGSMCCQIGAGKIQAIEVAVSMGLYMSEKINGAFKDTFMTFDSNSKIVHVKGSVLEKMKTIATAPWGGSTNIDAAFENMLTFAKKHKVSAEDMPEILMIFSDMQFDYCGKMTNYESLKAKYAKAGYRMPQVVFWNIAGGTGRTRNSPVTVREDGVALVSGFSPSIAQTVLEAREFSPRGMVIDAVMKPRYDVDTYATA